MHLEIVERDPPHQRTLSDGRDLAIRTLEFRWSLYDDAGNVVWNQVRSIPWSALLLTEPSADTKEKTMQALKAEIRESLDVLLMPRYLFPKVDKLGIPEASFDG
jgi:hypothetical protein